MKSLEEAHSRFDRVIPESVPAWPSAAFRILFALVALREVEELHRHRGFLWQRDLYSYPLVPAEWMLIVWAAALGLLLVGLWTRPVAIVNLIITVTVQLPTRLGGAQGSYSSSADPLLLLGA